MENMSSFSDVPPGFRFHPTDEELVDYYLRKKIASRRIDLDVIKEVDLYKIEPWDLQGEDNFYILNGEHIHRFHKNNLVKELCKLGTEEQNEWYFFSHKDKKYPTGTRTNRATKAGFWKATGRDKAIYSKNNLVGMRKTLVFYQGRAPNGQKSDWIMHEYRLETNENGAAQEEGWVVCRAFKKKMTSIRRFGEHESPCWYDEQVTFMPDFDSPRQITNQPQYSPYNNFYICKQELELVQYTTPHDTYVQLPHLESPKMIPSPYENNGSTLRPSTFVLGEDYVQQSVDSNYAKYGQGCDQEVTDWRVLDKFVASQLSQEEDPKEEKYLNACSFHENGDDIATEYATISTGTNFPIDMWK